MYSNLAAQKNKILDSLTGLQAEKIADSLFNRTKVAEAIIHYEHAKEQYKETDDVSGFIKICNYLNTIYHSRHEFAKSEENAITAFSQAKASLEKTDPLYIRAFDQYGSYHYEIGDYRSAVKYQLESLRLNNQRNPKDKNINKTLINISNSYIQSGDTENASYYAKSLLNFNLENGGEKTNILRANQLIGALYQKNVQLDSAFHYYISSEKLLDSIENKYQKGRHYLLTAEIAALLDQITIAKAFLAKTTKLNSNSDILRVKAAEIKGLISLKENKYKEGIKHYLRAHNLAKETKKRNNRSNRFKRIEKIIELNLAAGNIDKSLEFAQLGLSIVSENYNNSDPKTNPESDQIVSKLNAFKLLASKAEILSNIENTDTKSLLDTYLIAEETSQQIRRDILTESSKIDLLSMTNQIYSGGISTAINLYEKTGDEPLKELAFTLSQKSKASVLTGHLLESLAKGQSAIPDSLLQYETRLDIKITALKNQLLKSNIKTPKRTEINNAINDLNVERDQLINLWEKEYPNYYKIKHDRNYSSVSQLQQNIKSSTEAILEYFLDEENIYLFIISQNEFEVIRVGSVTSITDDIQKLQDLLKKGNQTANPKASFQSYSDAAFNLYKQLIAPSEARLGNKIDKLTIIPDGILNFIPFEVLIREKPSMLGYGLENMSYMIEDYDISYHYSSSLYNNALNNTEKQTPSKQLLSFAPTFSRKDHNFICNTRTLSSLKCTSEEVENIALSFPSQPYTDFAALKDTFIKNASDYNILHLATHACINREDPNYSKIYFTDDYLSFFELNNLNLNTELVVLSACDSGSGKLLKGEGNLSLARGFFIAGCKSSVMSLWEVDDCSTSDIMENFYVHLKNGQSKDKAIKNAKLDYLRHASKSQQHPSYWAPFIIYGKTSPLAAQAVSWNSSTLVYVFLGIIALLIIYAVIKKSSKKS